MINHFVVAVVRVKHRMDGVDHVVTRMMIEITIKMKTHQQDLVITRHRGRLAVVDRRDEEVVVLLWNIELNRMKNGVTVMIDLVTPLQRIFSHLLQLKYIHRSTK